ncbi:MAG: carboxylesterase/lipase family protein [Clostridia bacterium]|nr:carboxylesterase/lipase family protein [Clostridia bacterium]
MHTFNRDLKAALVETTLGAVKGYEHNGLAIFKGIPYATARRFHAPEPLEPWTTVRDASSYGYVCPLMTNERPTGEMYVPHRYWPMDEDCLNLNLWTPGLDDKRRPVLVWLHGGGYFAGSAIEHIAYDGANMSRFGDVVVISINHRLNILGYFDLSDFGSEYENSGNAGGDDIIAALRWIHENIERFGGDPDNVTVFGQSGGGGKVTTLLQSPDADGLYAKGCILSGVIGPVLSDASGSGRPMAEALMKELNLSDVKELETADYHLLSRAYLKLRNGLAKAGENVGCCPHPNAHYLGEPTINGFRPETAQVPLMIGSVFGEFASFAPIPWDRERLGDKEQVELVRNAFGAKDADELIPLFRSAYPERAIGDLLRLDCIFRGEEIRYIEKRSALNSATWSYLFNMDQPIDGGNTPWHCSDIPYWFHNIDLVEYPHGPQMDMDLPYRMQDAVFNSIIAFARNGNPANASIPVWPASRPGHENVLLLDSNMRVLENYDHDLIRTLSAYMQSHRKGIFAASEGNVQH